MFELTAVTIAMTFAAAASFVAGWRACIAHHTPRRPTTTRQRAPGSSPRARAGTSARAASVTVHRGTGAAQHHLTEHHREVL